MAQIGGETDQHEAAREVHFLIAFTPPLGCLALEFA